MLHLDGATLGGRGTRQNFNDFFLSVRGDSSKQSFPFLNCLKQLSRLCSSTGEIRSGIFITTSKEKFQDELLVFTTEFRSESITLQKK